ncbi:phosphatase PAP2 family protein [Sphingomonas sp.]|uniref:acid phosphatase n=1 Tax=Sphingomonas sp. TaxID=28214 RepID=UPI0031DBE90B
MLIGVAAVAVAQVPDRPLWVRDLPPGYLAPGSVDASAIVLPAPAKGDDRYAADRRVFRATRRMRDGERWKLATQDVEMAPSALMAKFSCAAGRRLSPATTPKLDRLMRRVLVDSQTINETAKRHFRRLRPFQIDKGAICQPASQLTSSFDYPSGHTVWGWSWAYILAESLPERATPILARGRAYGESRVVCGAHNLSATQAGGQVAAAAIAALHGSPAFRADMDGVREELAAAPMLDEGERRSCDVEERILRVALPLR